MYHIEITEFDEEGVIHSQEIFCDHYYVFIKDKGEFNHSYDARGGFLSSALGVLTTEVVNKNNELFKKHGWKDEEK